MASRLSNPIESKTKRQRLAPRREPYWYRLSAGCHLGYRQLAEGEGTWIAKFRDGGTGERSIRSLGTILDIDTMPAFEAARRQAQQWFDELTKGVDPEPRTVLDACHAYAKSVGDEKSSRRRRAGQDIARLIEKDPIATVDLFKLRSTHVEAWRNRMVEAPNRIGRSQRVSDKPRSAATINRDMVLLRAALNLAHVKGQAASDVAWRGPLAPLKNAQGSRDVDLTREQRKALIDAAAADLKPFLRALNYLPLRPGAVAAVAARDFDPRRATLTIRQDKRRKDGSLPPARTIPLPTTVAGFYGEQVKNKLPAALIFTQADGRPWNRNDWSIAVRKAVKDAGLPRATTAYTLRHSTITDLVVANGLSLLTIAQIAGTSVRMIEQTYGHLRQHDALKGLEVLAK